MNVIINGTEVDYQKSGVMRSAAYVDNYSLAALGLAGESGEYADLIKKELHHGVPASRDKKLKELGDILWYLTYAAACEGATLEEIAQMNVDKLLARYPNGFVKGGGVREGAGAP